jgi:hypothetical protein
MFDILKEIISHTYALGNIDLVKIEGTASETKFAAMSPSRSVVIRAAFKTPVTEMDGTFGLPNLGKLSTILGIGEYKENAAVSIAKQKRGDEEVPATIIFENEAGDFRNEYRLQSREIIDAQLPTPPFKGAKIDVTVTPSVASIQRFGYQAKANSEETKFTVKTVNGDLKFSFGDASTHSGNFVFHRGITGDLKKEHAWPIAEVLSVLGLSGDKVMEFSDSGALIIKVDSGLAEYSYIFPAVHV